MMYRVAVCDDDKEYAKQIKDNIKSFCIAQAKDVSITLYTESDDLMASIEKKLLYDLYILDIQMPLYSGMDILAEFKSNQLEADVILLTAHTGYAVETHDYNQVFRYIPKEEYIQKLELALTDFFIKMDQKLGCRPYIIQNKIKSVKIFQEDVVYIYKDKKYINFIMSKGGNERERCGLKAVYERLKNPEMVMLDRSYIINVRHIKRIQAGEVTLDTGAIIYTGQEHIIELKKIFNQYWSDLV